MGRLLLISNYFETTSKNIRASYIAPLGILSMATVMEQAGHECEVFDLNIQGLTVKDIFEEIRIKTPDLIGISAYTENIDYVFKLAKNIKKISPNSKIVVGGPHASLDPSYCLKSKYIDFVAVKEGENTIVELMEAIISNEKMIKFKDIPSLIFIQDKVKYENFNIAAIEDLDLLPIVKRSFIKSRMSRVINIITSRGCPAQCIYCSATALSGAKYRVRSVEDVYLEIAHIATYIDKENSSIYMVDDTFTVIKKRVFTFVNYVKLFELGVKWRCESRVDVMNKEVLSIMSEGGCENIQYGLESGSQEVLDKIKKKIDLNKALEIIALTHKYNISMCTSFMLGHYCDTKETLNETKRLIEYLSKKYGESIEIFLSYNTPFPGTWQYHHMDEIKMRFVKKGFKEMTLVQPIIETDHFTADDLRIIYYECFKYLNNSTKLDLEKLQKA